MDQSSQQSLFETEVIDHREYFRLVLDCALRIHGCCVDPKKEFRVADLGFEFSSPALGCVITFTTVRCKDENSNYCRPCIRIRSDKAVTGHPKVVLNHYRQVSCLVDLAHDFDKRYSDCFIDKPKNDEKQE